MPRTSINWTKEEDNILLNQVNSEGRKNWKQIAKILNNKTPIQCFYRFRKIDPVILKSKWSEDEDNMLLELQKKFCYNWSKISKIMKTRSPKQIRDRYINNLDPKIKRGNFSISEDLKILKYKRNYGNKWAQISKHFPDRSPDIIKSRYNSSIKNKMELLCFLQSLDYVNYNLTQNCNEDYLNLKLSYSANESTKVDLDQEFNNSNQNSNLSREKINFLNSSESFSEIQNEGSCGKF